MRSVSVQQHAPFDDKGSFSDALMWEGHWETQVVHDSGKDSTFGRVSA